MDRRPDRRGRAFPWLCRRGTRSICRTAPHPRTNHFCRLGIETSGSLEEISKSAVRRKKKNEMPRHAAVLKVSRNCVIYLIMQLSGFKMFFISLSFIQIIGQAMTFSVDPKGIDRPSIVDAQTIENQT